MIRFEFKQQPFGIQEARKANPQKLGEAIERHAKQNGGHIRVNKLHDEAELPRHPMHPHLQWDDKLAARAHRLSQIREIVNCLRLVEKPGGKQTRAFLTVTDTTGVSYRRLDDVLNDKDLQHRVMVAALRELQSFQERYEELKEICRLVRPARQRLEKMVRGEARP